MYYIHKLYSNRMSTHDNTIETDCVLSCPKHLETNDNMAQAWNHFDVIYDGSHSVVFLWDILAAKYFYRRIDVITRYRSFLYRSSSPYLTIAQINFNYTPAERTDLKDCREER